jgi:hypothetical protein
VAVTSLTYTAAAATAYAGTRGAAGHAMLGRSVLVPLLLAAGAAALAGLRQANLAAPWWERLPEHVRPALVGGATGLAAMTALSALVFSAAMVLHFSTALNLAEALGAGLVGGAVVAMVGLVYVPNAILFTGAYVTGPGFELGSGTSVTPAGVDLGVLPGHPLLAAVPTSSGTWWQAALVVLPVVAGAIGGLVAVRHHPALGFVRSAVRGGSAGLVAGTSFGLLTGLAVGSIGPGRMTEVGPNVLMTTAVAAVAMAVGGAIAAASASWLGMGAQGSDDSLS